VLFSSFAGEGGCGGVENPFKEWGGGEKSGDGGDYGAAWTDEGILPMVFSRRKRKTNDSSLCYSSIS